MLDNKNKDTFDFFEENKKNITHYNTPYGSLLMGIEAKKVEIAEAEDEIQLKLNFVISLKKSEILKVNTF